MVCYQCLIDSAMMGPLRLCLTWACALVLCGSLVSGAGKTPNKLIVRFSPIPFGKSAFFDMPRTVEEATKDSFAKVADRKEDLTTVMCRDGDFRVCLLFDQKNSVAGLQISVSKADAEASEAPQSLYRSAEWFSQTLLGVEVYSTIVFFVSKAELLQGGRTLTDSTNTAPEGIYILQNNADGTEARRLHATTTESEALSVGFTRQGCFPGMGQHYYQEESKDVTCEEHRPYFLLFGPKTEQMTGFGFGMYGASTHGKRKWFEKAFSLIDRIIVPNAPKCRYAWIDKYGLFTLHVYFVDNPWFTAC